MYGTGRRRPAELMLRLPFSTFTIHIMHLTTRNSLTADLRVSSMFLLTTNERNQRAWHPLDVMEAFPTHILDTLK
jgi:hypothetical protein